MPSYKDITKSIGSQIFSLMRTEAPSIFNPDWWEIRLMEWTMGDEYLKFQILRFIDVLPTLETNEQIAQHLKEYFPQPDPSLPLALRWGIISAKSAPPRVIAAATRRNVMRMALRFIAGATIEEAKIALKNLAKQNLTFTIDLLGEATTSEEEAKAYAERYIELIKGLSVGDYGTHTGKDMPSQLNVSIKLTSLYSQFDPIDPDGSAEAVKRRLRQIFRVARNVGAFINIDMEQYKYRDLTLRIFKEILEESEFHDFEDAGIVVQAYLKDSEQRLQELIDWTKARGRPITVRLVKGAYWDYEQIVAMQNNWPAPVFTRKWETDANYEKLTEMLLKNHDVLRSAIATHNIRSLAHAIATAQRTKVPENILEFQLLYGMGDAIKKALIKMGYSVRVYTPYGELIPGMAYLVRRILENTSNESFLRHSYIKDISEEELLKDPAEIAEETKSLSPDKPAYHKSSAKRHEPEPFAPFLNEPNTDFSKAENLFRLKKALELVSKDLGKTYPLFINGREVKAEECMRSLNPSRPDECVGLVAKATADHAEEAIQAARKALHNWRNVAPYDRANYLFRAAKIIRQKRFELSAWEIYEVGKTWREADADITETIDYLEYYGREMIRLSEPQLMGNVPGETNKYLYAPRGVGSVIAPWNFPMAILTGMTSAAIVSGNTVIMKPAKQSSVIAAKLMEILREAGIPPGVVNYLPGRGEEVGEYIVKSPHVNFIAFTGSRDVGRRINALAAQTQKRQEGVKKVIAEMGGKNAIIIDRDADLDESIFGTITSAFGYQGQKCSACSRVIVHRDVYDVFLNRLIEAARSIKIGPADEPGTFVGPLIDEEAQRKVLRYIALGKKEARVALETDVSGIPGKGYFVGPTIFAEVPSTAKIAREEIFGPVLCVMKASNFEEALSIANDVEYALTGGVYSRSPANIEKAEREFQVGNLYINRKITGAIVNRQPFGGFKMSGIGSKAGGPDYLIQFMIPRTITENTMRHGAAPIEDSPASTP